MHVVRCFKRNALAAGFVAPRNQLCDRAARVESLAVPRQPDVAFQTQQRLNELREVRRRELDRGIGYLRIYGASVAKQVFESDVLARVEELEKLARRGDLRREERIIDME